MINNEIQTNKYTVNINKDLMCNNRPHRRLNSKPKKGVCYQSKMIQMFSTAIIHL